MEPLSEKDFIQNKNPYPIWIWIFLLVVVSGMFYQFASIYWGGSAQQEIQQEPFYRVTNREMSLFLWQNPQYMRSNAVDKGGYLPGFDTIDQIALDTSASDLYAIAPPELFFLYHVWDRLVRDQFSNTPISPREFRQFLSFSKEWQPANWPQAPSGYRKFIADIQQYQTENLADLSTDLLPQDVRIAFQGWKNVIIQIEKIRVIRPTYTQMESFLRAYPHYARNYWQNIEKTRTPNYLLSFSKNILRGDDLVPRDEMTPFLMQAFFNFSELQSSLL